MDEVPDGLNDNPLVDFVTTFSRVLADEFDERMGRSSETVHIFFSTPDDSVGDIVYSLKSDVDIDTFSLILSYFSLGVNAAESIPNPGVVLGVGITARGMSIDPKLGAEIKSNLVYVSSFFGHEIGLMRFDTDTPDANAGEWVQVNVPMPFQVKIILEAINRQTSVYPHIFGLGDEDADQ